jgi:chemotaxis protein methyltransferase WspC
MKRSGGVSSPAKRRTTATDSPSATTLLKDIPRSADSAQPSNEGGPISANIPLDRARTLANAGRLAEARSACEESIRLQAELPEAYSLLGVIHQAEGRASEALEAFRKALYLAPSHAEALTHMIVLLKARGDAPQAAALQNRLRRLTEAEDQS